MIVWLRYTTLCGQKKRGVGKNKVSVVRWREKLEKWRDINYETECFRLESLTLRREEKKESSNMQRDDSIHSNLLSLSQIKCATTVKLVGESESVAIAAMRELLNMPWIWTTKQQNRQGNLKRISPKLMDWPQPQHFSINANNERKKFLWTFEPPRWSVSWQQQQHLFPLITTHSLN